jgi:hypothetical protein
VTGGRTSEASSWSRTTTSRTVERTFASTATRKSQSSRMPRLCEREAQFDMMAVERYFSAFFAALPFLVRSAFRGRPAAWVLYAGDQRTIVETDLYGKTVRLLDQIDDGVDRIQVHVSLHIMQHSMSADLFSLMPISKRLRYGLTARNVRSMELLKKTFNLYERGYLPVRKTLKVRFIREWARRWREILLYAEIILKRSEAGGSSSPTTSHRIDA